MHLIDKQEEFDKLCQSLEAEEIIYMDTEFYRRRTYYAKLCLIQIATKSDKYAIDTLNINIDALKVILSNPNICKVFHAPDQDIDIFYSMFKTLPQNVFDTQIAAGVVGMNPGIGYANLCLEILGIKLDKTMQATNWQKRPLSKQMLEYAIKDVEYLIPLHRELSATMNSRKLWNTFKSRSEKLNNVETFKPNFEKILKKILPPHKPESFKNKLMHLLEFREACARSKDIPRSHCANDHDLIKLAERLPTTEQELKKYGLGFITIAEGKFKSRLLELCAGLRETK